MTELARGAVARGFATLCAFTHQPSHFVKMGFTIVPHMWVPEKIAHDCTTCPLFRRCGQYAVTLPLRAGVQIRPEQPAAVIYAGRSVAARRPNVERLQLDPTPVFAEPRKTRCRRDLRGELPARSIDGNVTAPKGFRAAGVSCGIKAKGLDLALIVSDRPASAAGVFTINRAQAAPVIVSRRNLASAAGHARAIVVNSGCANACTGSDGMQHAEAMAARTASTHRLRHC